MKKLAAVLLTLALMVMMADASSLSAAIEPYEGGAAVFLVDSPDSASSSFVIESEEGGLSSFSVESPQTSAGAFLIENNSDGVGSFMVELLDGFSAAKLFYSQYPCLTH